MQTGFRFLRIDFIQEGVLRLKTVVAEGEIYSNKTIYEYDGKDERVKEMLLAQIGAVANM